MIYRKRELDDTSALTTACPVTSSVVPTPVPAPVPVPAAAAAAAATAALKE
jgi:hypothetical protein